MHTVVGGGDLQAVQVVAALILEDHGAAAMVDAACGRRGVAMVWSGGGAGGAGRIFVVVAKPIIHRGFPF